MTKIHHKTPSEALAYLARMKQDVRSIVHSAIVASELGKDDALGEAVSQIMVAARGALESGIRRANDGRLALDAPLRRASAGAWAWLSMMLELERGPHAEFWRETVAEVRMLFETGRMPPERDTPDPGNPSNDLVDRIGAVIEAAMVAAVEDAPSLKGHPGQLAKDAAYYKARAAEIISRSDAGLRRGIAELGERFEQAGARAAKAEKQYAELAGVFGAVGEDGRRRLRDNTGTCPLAVLQLAVYPAIDASHMIESHKADK